MSAVEEKITGRRTKPDRELWGLRCISPGDTERADEGVVGGLAGTPPAEVDDTQRVLVRHIGATQHEFTCAPRLPVPLDIYWRPWGIAAEPEYAPVFATGSRSASLCKLAVWFAEALRDHPSGRLAETTLPPTSPGRGLGLTPGCAELAPLERALDASRWMLELPDNWDGEGSPGYSEETWKRAARFLHHTAKDVWLEYHVIVEPPVVRNGPDGSIDIDWETADHELLVNVPVDPNEPATYYGRDRRGDEIKGTLNISQSAKWLFIWLAE